jgi:energy-coupling factor transporter ATP-binding protein EcfA2
VAPAPPRTAPPPPLPLVDANQLKSTFAPATFADLLPFQRRLAKPALDWLWSVSRGQTTAVPVCLLSGPPGCGKSTLVTVLASAVGYDTVKVIDTSSVSVRGVALMAQLKSCVLGPERCLVVLEDADALCAIADSFASSDSGSSASRYTIEDLPPLVSSLSRLRRDRMQPTNPLIITYCGKRWSVLKDLENLSPHCALRVRIFDAPLEEMTALTARIMRHLLDRVLPRPPDQHAHSAARLLDHGNHDLRRCYTVAYDGYLAAARGAKPSAGTIDDDLGWTPISAARAIVFGVADAGFGFTKSNTVDMAQALASLPLRFVLGLVQDNCQDAFADAHASGTPAMSALAMDSLASAVDRLADIDLMAGSLYGCYSDTLSDDVAHYLTAHTVLTCRRNASRTRLTPFYPSLNGSVLPWRGQSRHQTVALPLAIRPPDYNPTMRIEHDRTRWEKLNSFRTTASALRAHDADFFCGWDHRMALVLKLVTLMKAPGGLAPLRVFVGALLNRGASRDYLVALMTSAFPHIVGDPLEWQAFFDELTPSVLGDMAPLVITVASAGSTPYVANGIVKRVSRVPSSSVCRPAPVSDPAECAMRFVRLPPRTATPTTAGTQPLPLSSSPPSRARTAKVLETCYVSRMVSPLVAQHSSLYDMEDLPE